VITVRGGYRVSAAVSRTEECPGPPAYCSMCGSRLPDPHIHAQSVQGDGLSPCYGFCSEECAGRWVAGEPVVADRRVT
jgi:hypothetical protein